MDDKLRLHDVKPHLQQDNPARNVPSRDLVFVQVNALLGDQGRVATADKMILEDEVEDASELPQSDILLINKADVSGYVGVYCLDLHICGDRQVVTFITHEPPQIFSNLLENNIVGL